ncbi:hypothetical protein C1645_807562 [Glomus cerebriforme]|uniref:BZIP domain-containing protein n=1 Tax=Glomus cerebriforme TaxID=658196 RepID=A0A397SPS5_9GLOM|nr:hypothetical protein C1645_807562 [Glomus cerebriforme]
MVSTPTPSCDDPNNKVNIMSQYQDYSQYIDFTSTGSPQKSGGYEETWIYDLDLLTGNDLFYQDSSTYNISPELTTSSMTTPSLTLDGISTPHDLNQDLNDSPLFNHSYVPSPSLEPALDFFPDLSNDSNVSVASGRSLLQLAIPSTSIIIPVDDSPLNAIPVGSAHSPALTIPWSTDFTNSTSTEDVQNSSSSMSLSSFSPVNSPNISSTVVSSTVTSPLMPSDSINSRSRKRSISRVDKDPQVVADELALKRAKNTDAARRSRLRKQMRMESLVKQVADLKTENNDLQTRIAVLESEKKGLEDKYTEKDTRVNMLEQQLAEAHERLIKRNAP